MSQVVRQVRLYHRDALGDGAIERAAIHCGFKRVSVAPQLSVFSVGPSWGSWGEKVEVFSLQFPDRLAIDVRSMSRLAVAYADFGKNEDNVRRFVAALDGLAGDSRTSEAIKLCAHCGYPSIDRAAKRCAECGEADLVETLRPSRKSCLIGELWFIGILTGVEAAAILGAKYMGWSGHIPYLFSHPIYGVLNLAAFNGGLTIVIWLMHLRAARKQRRKLSPD
jgi:hypothetical protein